MRLDWRFLRWIIEGGLIVGAIGYFALIGDGYARWLGWAAFGVGMATFLVERKAVIRRGIHYERRAGGERTGVDS